MDGNSTDDEVTFREVDGTRTRIDVAEIEATDPDERRKLRQGNTTDGADLTALAGALREVVAKLDSVQRTIGTIGRPRSHSPGHVKSQPQPRWSPEVPVRASMTSGFRRDVNNSHFADERNNDRCSDPYYERRQCERGYDRRSSKRPMRAEPKFPPFSGTENCAVWIAKFEAIADRYHWGPDEKLDNILPKLEGLAGEFAFTQLPPHVINNYDILVAEMTNHFRMIKTAQSYAVRLNRRVQRQGETTEEFAADLKCLYDKTHRNRDRQTRDEDLVRRFFDGLLDQDARFAVEFNKAPSNIDEAVFYVLTGNR
ncbi:hypothetical protein DPMN_137211 [Dreissena polymorpha]|uniref:Gag protein n=1 Tax=Dreissena polymorpha TaxID=45954 RepID=A0A9D4JIL6_DREPO|nr:hypothetical protein DPMN_137211 [Dreissena polymorpha]